MSWNSTEAEQIGRMEQKLDDIVEDVKEHGPRLVTLETFTNRVKGVLAVALFVGGLVTTILLTGCAHFHNKGYYPDGQLKRDVVSTILGKGETTLVIEDGPATTTYSTSGTGIWPARIERHGIRKAIQCQNFKRKRFDFSG